MRHHYIYLCLIAAPIAAIAADITGIVNDAQNTPLPGASVMLSDAGDSTRREFTFSDENGLYRFNNIKPGKYNLTFQSIGMGSEYRTLNVADSDSLITIPPVNLLEEAVELKEAVVTAVRAAVVAKQDTLEFNAGSFHTNPNASVGDLLKKLPGVEVDKEGNITSGGKTIKKILVDGKEFFSDDPTMASKNLPSDMVEKVQVIDRKSDAARLTGVDDGEEETVINLSVKKNMKNGWFGTVGAGMGTDGRYEANFNINSFKNDNQFSFVGGANNINDLGFSDMGRGRFRSFGPSGGITDSQRFGVNFNVGNGEKFRVGGNIFYTHTKRHADSYTVTKNLFADSISTSAGGSASRDNGHALNANFRMQWNIDDYNTIDFRPTFYYNTRNSLLNDSTILYSGELFSKIVNRQLNLTANKGDSYSAAGDFIYNHKFASRPGRSFSTQFKYSFSNTDEHTTSLNDISFPLLEDADEILYRYLDSHQWTNSLEGRLTWTEPIGDNTRGNYLTFAYNIRYNSNNADKYTYNLPSPEEDILHISDISALDRAPEGLLPTDSLSNRFRNKFLTQEVRLGYKKVAKAYNLEAGVVFSPAYSKSTDLIDYHRNIPSRTVWNIAPFFRLRYKFSKSSSMRLNYRARTSAPSSKQLQPVADVSDPMNIVIGNPELKPTFTQSFSGFFNNFNSETQQSLMAMVNGSVSLNSIVSRTISNPQSGARTTTYANANGDFNIMGMMMLNQPLRNRKWRYTVNTRLSYFSKAGYINRDFNRSGNLSVAPTLGMTFSSDIFQISANPQYSFNMATNSLPSQRNQYIHTYGFNADASLYLPFGLQLNSDITYSTSSGYGAGFNTTEWLWNAQLSYSVLHDKSLTFSVRAYDLLGQNKNVSRTVSANKIVDSSHNDLTRYVMFGVSYTFNTLKSRKRANQLPGEMPPSPGGMPPGPPPGGFHGGGGRPF